MAMCILREEALVRCGIGAADRVLIALSGGADSVALLLELKRMESAGRVGRIGAAHLNHGIRGEEAARDASFCRSLCERLGVPLVTETADVPAIAKAQGLSLETAARDARYAFLERVRAEGGFDWIATAHHRDDQAETLLLHLLRGCGTDGLAGMRNQAGRIVRPLLGVSRAEILAFLAEKDQPYCTDSTNESLDATRNRIRHTVFPLLDAIRPDAAGAFADAASLVRTDVDYLNGEADRLWHTVTDRAKLMELPDALRLRVLKRYLPYADYERSDLLTLDALLSAQTGTRRDLKRGYVAWVSDRRLYIGSLDAPAYCVPLAIGGTAIVPGGTVTARRVQHASFPCKPNTAYVRESAVSGALTVRSPQTGDRFTPFGMAGSKLLSDYFTDRKVPRGFRSVPIVADEAGILWVAGYTVDERARVAAHNTAILELQYEEVPAHVGK